MSDRMDALVGERLLLKNSETKYYLFGSYRQDGKDWNIVEASADPQRKDHQPDRWLWQIENPADTNLIRLLNVGLNKYLCAARSEMPYDPDLWYMELTPDPSDVRTFFDFRRTDPTGFTVYQSHHNRKMMLFGANDVTVQDEGDCYICNGADNVNYKWQTFVFDLPVR